jgi:crotonobetaine/carnitine-CoA ligase
MSSEPFGRIWLTSVERYGKQPFLTWLPEQGPGQTWSYAEFDELAAAASGGLAQAGVGTGDRVHLVHPNGPAFVLTWLAVTRLGAIMVAADPRATSPELAAQIDLTEPVVAVVTAANARVYDRARELAARQPPQVISCDPGATTLGARGEAAAGTAIPSARPADVPPTAPAALMFTSGTTSAPKAVIVTQANYSHAGEIMATAAGVTAQSKWIVCLPLFHANAQYYCFTAAISRGAEVCLLPRFSASGFIASARVAAATHASLFAAPIRMILRGTPPGTRPARLVHCWYAQNLTAAEYDGFAGLTSCAPRQLYGMTETMAAVLTNPAGSPLADSMGRVTPGCRVRVVTSDMHDAEPGEEGEVVVQGVAGIDISPGYWRNESATREAFTSGGLRTGDYAVRDADGFHFFRGRRSDILKVGGENVSTVEIEAVLATHPAVREVAVVGEPHDVLDEVPVAYVVLEPGLDEEATLSDLTGWSEQSLAPSKRPRAFRTVDQLPRTSVGKIRKVSLRAAAASDPTPTGGTPA